MGEMMTSESMRRNEARVKAEQSIQRILIDLDGEIGTITDVQIDTRNFSNLRVEIYLKDEPA